MFPLVRRSLGSSKRFPDAFAVNDDLVDLNKRVRTRGYWAADMAQLAERSLLHFLMTSGRATQPLTPGAFGAKR